MNDEQNLAANAQGQANEYLGALLVDRSPESLSNKILRQAPGTLSEQFKLFKNSHPFLAKRVRQEAQSVWIEFKQNANVLNNSTDHQDLVLFVKSTKFFSSLDYFGIKQLIQLNKQNPASIPMTRWYTCVYESTITGTVFGITTTHGRLNLMRTVDFLPIAELSEIDPSVGQNHSLVYLCLDTIDLKTKIWPNRLMAGTHPQQYARLEEQEKAQCQPVPFATPAPVSLSAALSSLSHEQFQVELLKLLQTHISDPQACANAFAELHGFCMQYKQAPAS